MLSTSHFARQTALSCTSPVYLLTEFAVLHALFTIEMDSQSNSFENSQRLEIALFAGAWLLVASQVVLQVIIICKWVEDGPYSVAVLCADVISWLISIIDVVLLSVISFVRDEEIWRRVLVVLCFLNTLLALSQQVSPSEPTFHQANTE